MAETAKDILSDLFRNTEISERRNVDTRGRPKDLVRRPVRATKKGFTGRSTGLTGRDRSGELEPSGVPQAPEEAPEKHKRITEFDNLDDWVLSMIMIAIMHAEPDLSPEDAIKLGKVWARRLYLPKTNYLWRTQAIRIKRHGIRAEASKIRRELYKML